MVLAEGADFREGEVQVDAGEISPIVLAIQDAEKLTSAEIRVALSSQRFFAGDAYKKARKVFAQYGMHKTRERNSVLIFVNLKKHQFAFVGDEGIHKKVGEAFWKQMSTLLHQELISTHYERAIGRVVRVIGFSLQKYFPAKTNSHEDAGNELSNEVIST